MVLHGNAAGFVLYYCSFYGNMFVVRRPPAALLTAVTPRVRRPPKMVTAAAEHSFFLHNTAWNMMEWCCHTGVNDLQTARRPYGDKTMTTCAHYGSSPACASEPAGRTTSGRIKTNGGMLHYPRKTTWHAAFRLHATHNIQG